MKYKTKTINISTLEKENGETFLIFPKSKVRLVVDATKADYDDWFVKMFYEKFFDKMNNIYNFELVNVKITKNSISGTLVGTNTVTVGANRSWILDVVVLEDNIEKNEIIINGM